MMNGLTHGSLLLFGGMGVSWWKLLPAYRSIHGLKGFFKTVSEVLEDERERLDANPFSRVGTEMKAWLEGAPGADSRTLHYCSIAMPMTFLIQMANAYLWQAETSPQASRRIAGSVSHSQGIVAAVLFASQAASQSGSGAQDFTGLGDFLRFLFRFGMRAQECFPFPEADAEEASIAANLGLGEPSPMLAIMGMPARHMADLVDDFNTGRAGGETLSLALINSPTSTVVSADRKTLLAFLEAKAAPLKAFRSRTAFVKASCPLHSPIMQAMEAPFRSDVEAMGFRIAGEALAYPVFSSRDGANYQQSEDIAGSLCREMALEKCDWGSSLVSALRETGAKDIQDFGPGHWCSKWLAPLLDAAGQVRIPLTAHQNGTGQEK